MKLKKLTTLVCTGLLAINSTGLTVLAASTDVNDPNVVQSTEDLNGDGVIDEKDDEILFENLNNSSNESENQEVLDVDSGENQTPETPPTIPETEGETDGNVGSDIEETPEVENPEIPETDVKPGEGENSETPNTDTETDSDLEKPETPDVDGETNEENPSENSDSNSTETPEVEVPETDVKPEELPETPENNVPEVEETNPSENNVENEVVEEETQTQESILAPTHKYDSENASYQKFHYSENIETERFIAMVGEQARQIASENDLYASVAIAQAILESDSGNSFLSKEDFNLFGMKGSYNGNYATYWTKEDDGNGNLYDIQANFCVYENYGESFSDYVDLLTNPERMGNFYYGTTKTNAATAEDACKFLQGRYATDTQYASKLMSLIDTYDLTRFDEELETDLDSVNGVRTITDIDEDGNEYQREFTNEDYAKLAGVITSKLGIDYVWGGESISEGGYDCSGLVYSAYQEAFGVTLPRTSQTMALLGEEISFDQLQMGDLLFWDDGGDVHHVAMYLGDGYYIQSPHTGDVVRVTSMDEYRPDFAKRILTFEEKEM